MPFNRDYDMIKNKNFLYARQAPKPPVINNPRPCSKCVDCGVDCIDIGEMYNVKNWPNVDGWLCVGCIERRLGCQLVASDFSDSSINGGHYACSERLANRQGRRAVPTRISVVEDYDGRFRAKWRGKFIGAFKTEELAWTKALECANEQTT